MTWDAPTAAWWAGEIADDPTYREVVDPLLGAVLGQTPGGPVLDLGCGDGRHAGAFPATIGIDSSPELAAVAGAVMPVCVADVTRLPFAGGTAGAAYAVLVLEHVADHRAFFLETARIVRPGGWLALVANHPLWTAPGSGPFVDPEDGEVLWRWGTYLKRGKTDEPAGEGTVRFHHRPLGDLLDTAAGVGWRLDTMLEAPVSPAEDPLLAAQDQIPRLIGLRWSR